MSQGSNVWYNKACGVMQDTDPRDKVVYPYLINMIVFFFLFFALGGDF